MSTRIEFYERLREHIPDEAARLIAEEMPTHDDHATKEDVGVLKQDLNALELSTEEAIHRVEISVEKLRSSMFRWNLVFFVPLWVGTYATLAAIVLRGSP